MMSLLEILEFLRLRTTLKRVALSIADRNIPRVVPRIRRVLPHDPAAYTQGLAYSDGRLYEGTGLIGHSTVREINVNDGSSKVLYHLEPPYFGEGIAVVNGLLFQLTWTSRTAMVYDMSTWRRVKTLHYGGEGWGLTARNDTLLMSNGSSLITICNQDLTPLRTLRAISHWIPLRHINEIEWVQGKIYANVLNSSNILEIDGRSGRLLRIIDCASLIAMEKPGHHDHVLNGIAYKAETKTFFLAGKCWRQLFEVEIPSEDSRVQ
jgi:glutaminyl-peptide cyclotransferase